MGKFEMEDLKRVFHDLSREIYGASGFAHVYGPSAGDYDNYRRRSSPNLPSAKTILKSLDYPLDRFGWETMLNDYCDLSMPPRKHSGLQEWAEWETIDKVYANEHYATGITYYPGVNGWEDAVIDAIDNGESLAELGFYG